ncbi:hypothetical protein BOX15_Mlig026858g3 [Macrostomum lignano]|nr:hypothetical protein BOX15_Mlig026858g3 [Macrostomum lignano]
MDFPRSTTSKYIRAFALAKYGHEYVQAHVFGEFAGPSQRPMASTEVITELQRVLNKVFRIPREHMMTSWHAVKDSLNRIGPETNYRKRKSEDRSQNTNSTQ